MSTVFSQIPLQPPQDALLICLSLGGKVCDDTTMDATIEYNKEGIYLYCRIRLSYLPVQAYKTTGY